MREGGVVGEAAAGQRPSRRAAVRTLRSGPNAERQALGRNATLAGGARLAGRRGGGGGPQADAVPIPGPWDRLGRWSRSAAAGKLPGLALEAVQNM